MIVVHSSGTLQRAAARCMASIAVAAIGTPALAVLGGDASSVEADRLQMRATRQAAQTAVLQGSVQEMRLADGSSIRQFINTRGIVYAVAWRTRTKPDFARLLGQYANTFDAGIASAAHPPGLKRSVTVDRGDLVVVSSGRPGAFVGRAWLKSELPDGVRADALR
ncbi:MAG TPA: DUF2844 domain-containing protein [Burkholderiaceae bacterium]|nr:DUF2844 domain-containing protein [Burkholderiaceae bacterium]